MQKNQKIKAKNKGLPHGFSKCVSLKAGSAFFESKRSAEASRPALSLNPLSSAFGGRCSRFWPRPTHPTRLRLFLLKVEHSPLQWRGAEGEVEKQAAT